MAKVPCEFRADRPTFVFQGKVETSRRAASSPEEGASSAAGGSGDATWLIFPRKVKGGGRGGHLPRQ